MNPAIALLTEPSGPGLWHLAGDVSGFGFYHASHRMPDGTERTPFLGWICRVLDLAHRIARYEARTEQKKSSFLLPGVIGANSDS
jgi:hypothetical protein